MVSFTGLVLVIRRHSSSSEIFIGYLIFTIFFKHTRTNLSSLSSSVTVILHISAPYTKAGSTLLLNKRSFVFQLYDSDFLTFPRILKEFLAFESLFLMPAPASPSLATVGLGMLILQHLLSLIWGSLCYLVFLHLSS